MPASSEALLLQYPPSPIEIEPLLGFLLPPSTTEILIQIHASAHVGQISVHKGHIDVSDIALEVLQLSQSSKTALRS